MKGWIFFMISKEQNMADIRPFAAVRPDRQYASEVAALPYDVYNRAEAKAVVAKNPLSFLKIDRAETQFDDSVSTYDDVVYRKASDMYEEMKRDRTFVADEKPCFYLYELTMNGRSQTGIVGCASIDDYQNNVIKKHENTRADKEEDRIRHVDALGAQTGPIFLAYHADAGLAKITDIVKKDAPDVDFVSEDGIRHRTWTVSGDEEIRAIQAAFANMDSVYIADGHHRCASAVRVGQKCRETYPESAYFLSVLFPDNELLIMDYNRVLKDLNGHTEEEFLAHLRSVGTLTKLTEDNRKPVRKGQCTVYFQNTWYSLDFDQTLLSDDPVKGLDVSVLQDHVLQPFFDITDPRVDQRIEFVGGIRGLGELERRVHEDCVAAFAMYPTQISELFAVADAGRLMPPKSTWFEPKLRSGLFIHDFK